MYGQTIDITFQREATKHHVSLKTRRTAGEKSNQRLRNQTIRIKITTKSNDAFHKNERTANQQNSIRTKRSTHSALIRFPTKNHLNGQLIVIKFQK